MSTPDAEHPGNSHDHQEQKEERHKREMRGALMVVASLIATSTYQAAVNPPQGLKDSDYARYVAFRFFNTFTFVNSVGIMTQLLLDAVVTADIEILGVAAMKVLMIMNLFCFAVAFALAFSTTWRSTFVALAYPTAYILMCAVVELLFKRQQRWEATMQQGQMNGQPVTGGVSPHAHQRHRRHWIRLTPRTTMDVPN